MIIQATVLSFKRELFLALHDFAVDTFKIALYSPDSDIGVNTAIYSTTEEVVGTGYVAGGFNLTVESIVTDGEAAIASFEALITAALTINNIAGGLIYNSSKADRAVVALDFGRTLVKTAEPLTITFPAANQTSGLIRIQ